MADETSEVHERAAATASRRDRSPDPASPPVAPESGSFPHLGCDDLSSEFGGIDPALARLVEEITGRFQAGEPVDIERIERENPAWVEAIRMLTPALRELAQLAAASDVDSPAGGIPDRAVPRIFGDFRIHREIGRGGMGVVYEAVQLPMGRRVALKVALAAAAMDAKALQRFQLEAQVAGLLQHPRIVPVHAVGAIGDIPYYAMQLIEGGSLADLIAEMRGMIVPDSRTAPASADGRKIGTLAIGLLSGRFAPPRADSESGRSGQDLGTDGSTPTANRSVRTRSYVRTVARLGVQAAEALAYAHEQGITHRDIKPANLLLDGRGDLWVADFGMADVQGDAGLTGTGDLPGTLRYMSPEQAMGERSLVDRRTDIYSLGATLYELLSLRPAIAGADRQEIFRRIAEDEPTPIRQLNPAVPFDLATILAKAMSKEPARRYETAGHLADDLVRFLEGRPIAARPVGPIRRAWRWCQRKPMLAGLTASLTLALVGGFAGITWSWREAIQQKSLLLVAEKEARSQAAISEAINRFLVDRILGQASPENNPDANRVTLLEVLDRAAEEVGTSFAAQPRIEATIRMAIARAYHGLGENGRSEPHFRAALALFRREPGAAGGQGIQAMSDLGHALCHLGRLDEAEPLLRDSVAESERRLGPSDPITHAALDNLADFESSKNHLAEAESLYRRHLDDVGRTFKPGRDADLDALNNLVLVVTKRGKPEEAEAICRQLVEDSRSHRGPRHPGTLSAINNLAILLEKRGAFAEAEQLFRQVLDANRQVLGPNHPGHFAALFNLAHVLADLGRLDEAEALFRRNLEDQRRILAPDHPTTLYTTSRLAALLRSSGRLDEAERLLRPCLDAQRRVLGPDHPDTLRTAGRLDEVLKARDRIGAVTPVARER